jgi:hypothetical protein
VSRRPAISGFVVILLVTFVAAPVCWFVAWMAATLFGPAPKPPPPDLTQKALPEDDATEAEAVPFEIVVPLRIVVGADSAPARAPRPTHARRKRGPNAKLAVVYAKAASREEPYAVSFELRKGRLFIECECAAGERKQWCKHKLAFARGDASFLYQVPHAPGERVMNGSGHTNEEEYERAREWIANSPLPKLVEEWEAAALFDPQKGRELRDHILALMNQGAPVFAAA